MPKHDPTVSWFPLGDEAALAPELRELYAKCRDRLGFVPNVFQAFQWRPERLRPGWATTTRSWSPRRRCRRPSAR